MNEPQMFADLQDAGNAQAQLILQAIARHADWDTGQCWPGDEAISRMAKCSTRTVQTYLRKLEEDGLILREDRRSDRGTKMPRKLTLVGYAEWIAALREGGKVSKPKVVSNYEQPPESLSGGPPENLGVTTGKLSSVTTGKQAARQEHSLNVNRTKSARAREEVSIGFGSEGVMVTRADNPQALIAWEKYAERRLDEHQWRTAKRLIKDHGFFQAPSLYPPDFAPNMKEAAE